MSRTFKSQAHSGLEYWWIEIILMRSMCRCLKFFIDILCTSPSISIDSFIQWPVQDCGYINQYYIHIRTYSSSQKVHYEISSEIFSMVKLKLWLPDVLWITYIWIRERYHCRTVIILSYTIRNSCMELNCKLCYSPWFTHYVIQHSKNTYLDCLSAISCI